MEGRRDAIIIIVLSTIVGLSGNAFLGLTGALCGTMVLCGNLERAPDMIAMLSFATSLLAAIWSIMVLPVGIVLITASPQRLCAASQQMLGYINPTPADSTAPVGYPWNMTEASHPTYTAFSPKLLGTTQRISGLVCGEDAGMFTALVGLGALLYFCGVCLPLMYLSGRLMRTARRAGGCNDCASGPQVTSCHSVWPRTRNSSTRPSPSDGRLVTRPERRRRGRCLFRVCLHEGPLRLQRRCTECASVHTRAPAERARRQQ